MGESARGLISEISHQDLDKWLRTSTFTNELEEVMSYMMPWNFFFAFIETRLTLIYSLLEDISIKN